MQIRKRLYMLFAILLLLPISVTAQEQLPLSSAAPAQSLVGGWELQWVPEEGLGENTASRGCLVVARTSEPGDSWTECFPSNNLRLETVTAHCVQSSQFRANCHIYIDRILTDGEAEGIGDRFTNFLNELGDEGVGVFRFEDVHCTVTLALGEGAANYSPSGDC